jgi:hypothetical protein
MEMKKKTEIDFGFIARTLKTMCLVLIVFFPFGIYYLGFFKSLAILSGGIWGILNLIFISMLVRFTLHPGGPDAGRAIAVALIKFPLLYLGGYFLLKVPQFEPLLLMIGFSGLLGVIILKLLGRLFTGMDSQANGNQSVEGMTTI